MFKSLRTAKEKRQGPARRYYRGLCTVTATSIIIIIFILLSLVYQFPGKNNSILDIENPSITYKIYIFQYCVSTGDQNDNGVDKNPNAKDGLGCHLDLNPLGYIVATTNKQAEPSDLATFYTLMTIAFAFYYVGCHAVALTIYLWWRWFNRHFDPGEKVPKKSFKKLMLACFKKKKKKKKKQLTSPSPPPPQAGLTIFCIPASCLTHASYLGSGIAGGGIPKSYSKIGNLYMLFVHSLWLWYLASLLIVFLLFRKEYPKPPKEKKEEEEKSEDMESGSGSGSGSGSSNGTEWDYASEPVDQTSWYRE
ncbi:hypothetical protein BELL_0295g00080 [Botrytis elliptica]|uniref:Uncharacterized protein n=1 Tax=Botrytis elliptica TaxID=278938 RepID=A0A4Z1JKK6_9HELO|nr:hypothetical protein BELL_0295g00080 [Botrytis elliptica]